jgi:omega-amidase
MKDLKISLIQSEIVWEDTKANLHSFENQIDTISEETHLVILPEMFTTGFSMHTHLAHDQNSEVLQWMKRIAETKNIHLCGSIMFKENEMYYNRFFVFSPSGSYTYYNKRHCFRMANEHQYYKPGNKSQIFEINGWKICPQICYDLRFPVFTRNKIANNTIAYDVLLYVANWPERRKQAWQKLLPARAIENSCYTIGVNRVGQDGNNIEYSGNSAAYNFLGDTICDFDENKCGIKTISLNYKNLIEYREKFPVLLDADSFEIL